MIASHPPSSIHLEKYMLRRSCAADRLRSLAPGQWAAPRAVAVLVLSARSTTGVGPGDRIRYRSDWYRCYPTIMEERWRDMYHCYYPYLFDHGDRMSLYPKIADNPREWQPGQLQTTYDAIREDKYDGFMRLRGKFPELYQDTHLWENPPPFGDFNMFYSVRAGLIGVKAFTQTEYDDLGNKMDLTAIWVPDNQVVAHRTKERDGNDSMLIGAMNVPAEFHKPHVTAFYKSKRVAVKHVNSVFRITPDAFVPVGTRLDVRHFKVGQELQLAFQYTDFGYQGVMFRYGHDGGVVWLGDKKWQRRPGSIGTEGQGRVLPGTRQPGQTGAHRMHCHNVPVYRIDFKQNLIYVASRLPCDVGAYVRMNDEPHILGKVGWNTNRGFPPFPTFIPSAGEDVSTMSTEECQIVSLPLYDRLRDDFHATEMISQSDIDDARAAKPAVVAPKREIHDFKKFAEGRRKRNKMMRDNWKKIRGNWVAKITEKQQEATRKKIMERRRVR